MMRSASSFASGVAAKRAVGLRDDDGQRAGDNVVDLSREVGALLLGIALELLTLSGQILLRGLLGTATQLAVQQRHGQQNDAPEDVGESLGRLERGERGDDERGGCGVAKQQCTRGMSRCGAGRWRLAM